MVDHFVFLQPRYFPLQFEQRQLMKKRCHNEGWIGCEDQNVKLQVSGLFLHVFMFVSSAAVENHRKWNVSWRPPSSFAWHLDVCSVNVAAPGVSASSWSDKSNGSEWKDPSPWWPQRNGCAPWGVPLVSSSPVDTDLLPIKKRRWNAPLKMACLSSWGVLVGMKWDERERWQTTADSLLTTCFCCKIK